MRKDIELFLRRILEYRREKNKDSFIISYRFFEEIPSIETARYFKRFDHEWLPYK